MKETYAHPMIANSDIVSNNNGIWSIAAAARKITHAIKAAPVSKLQSLTRRNSN